MNDDFQDKVFIFIKNKTQFVDVWSVVQLKKKNQRETPLHVTARGHLPSNSESPSPQPRGLWTVS